MNKIMEFNRGIEGRQAALPSPDRLEEQGVHLLQFVYPRPRNAVHVGLHMLVQPLLFHFV